MSTKFHDPRFLGIADYHYIMAPAKSVRKNNGIMDNVLRAIARANATAMMRAHGVRWGEDGAEFPHH